MKKIITLLLALFVVEFSFGKQVDEITAKAVAYAFLSSKTNLESTTAEDFKLVYQSTSNTTSSLVIYFYVFNTGNGFVMISGDDIVTPVLGYSTEKEFNATIIPSHIAYWLDGYKKQINFAIENHLPATTEITQKWQNLEGGSPLNDVSRNSVSPFMLTNWDQSPYYNDLCPFDATEGEYSVTGCVATAMAQVMKYWNYPATGTSSHSYTSPYGTLSATFSSSTYNWGSMPNSISSANADIAKLMSDVGISVDMGYGVASAGGSGAYVITSASPVTNCTEYAMPTYFGYKNTIQGLERSWYSDTDWMTMLKGELDASRPVIYAGFGSGGGHCFDADGYDNSDFIHFNWGWGGWYNGYFEIDALNPGGVGTGGGTGGFNSDQQMVIGIEPTTINVPLPDPYETNNTSAEAFDLPVSFVGNAVHIKTDSSSCHVNGDLDYYKIELPVDYVYTITPRLNDLFSTVDGNTYTLNAKFAYSTDGGGIWSPTYNTNVTNGSGNIYITGNAGGTIYFKVMSFAVGYTGTYSLAMDITRSSNVTIDEVEPASLIDIYPNPTKDLVMIDLANFKGTVSQVKIQNILGKQVMSISNPSANESTLRLSLANLPKGAYFIQMQTSNGVITKKIALTN